MEKKTVFKFHICCHCPSALRFVGTHKKSNKLTHISPQQKYILSADLDGVITEKKTEKSIVAINMVMTIIIIVVNSDNKHIYHVNT